MVCPNAHSLRIFSSSEARNPNCLVRESTKLGEHIHDPQFGDGPDTASESTFSSTELSEFFGPHRVPGTELSELRSAYYLCAKATSPSFPQNSATLGQNFLELVYSLTLRLHTNSPELIRLTQSLHCAPSAHGKAS